MAVRISGSTQRPPNSGPVSPPGVGTKPGSVNIVNTSIFITGHTVIEGASEFVTPNNVGSISNPYAASYIDGILTVNGVPISEIDGYNLAVDAPGAMFSTTAERQEAAVYFSGGVGIEQDLSVGGLIYGRISQANTATTSSQLIVLSNKSDYEFFPAFTNKVNANRGNPAASNLEDIGSNFLYGDASGVTEVPLNDQTHITYNPFLGRLTLNNLHITSTATTTATNSGSVIVDGGVGIAKDLTVGNTIYPGSVETSTIGTSSATWAKSYLENIYTKFLGNSLGNIEIAPNNGINFPNSGNGGTVDIFGEIRVRGNNPIGTAPVVTNILYVTMDGNDSNDGRAMDPSRACRTVTGAVNSPAYQSGTQIRVAPGHYLENNPIQLKPYTSVVGSDLRTTSIEPMNKTQDLFHMNSGCYLAFMQFLNGRSGLLPGTYANGYNRGAYCTAFPPLPVGEQITLFHSPYIQNCTNLTGPWLKDGTMFVPNETVQIPFAVGTGTWVANTTSIVVNFQNLPINGFIYAGVRNSSSTQYTNPLALQPTIVPKGTVADKNELLNKTNPVLFDAYTATDTGAIWVYTEATGIQLGQSIDTGPQNPGFFNARTLMLANKKFIQWQVVSWINQQILANAGMGGIWDGFEYDRQICYRDVGILIENVAYDVTFGGNEKSIESGLAYWKGAVSLIATERSQTTAAISQLETLLEQVVVNSLITPLPPVTDIPVDKQVINFVMIDGDVAIPSMQDLFGIITEIITNGPDAAPAKYNSGGPDAAFISAEILMQANRTFIQENTINYINWNLVGGSLPYNKIKCARDSGIIIDSIAADLLHPTTAHSQTTFAGLQYYSQNGYIGNIGTEIVETTRAIAYLQKIAAKVIQNITTSTDALLGITRFSNATQDFSYQPATDNEVATLNSEFGIITSILSGDVTGWTDALIPNGSPSNLINVQNAYNSLLRNTGYMTAEVIAYIQASGTIGGLDFHAFDVSTCERDIGYIIKSVAFDILHGGNRQAIQSGLSYYSQVGGATVVPQEVAATSQAFTFLGGLINTLITAPLSYTPSQIKVLPVLDLPVSSSTVTNLVTILVNTLTNIISNGPTGYGYSPINTATSYASEITNAYNIIGANRKFIVAETLAYLDRTFNPTSFNYDQAYCYRDIGLMVDAVSQDILLGGNQKSIEAGSSYWNQGYNYIANELTTTTAAISYISDISKKIIKNQVVAPVTGTVATQIINTFFQYGDDYMPQEAIGRNFGIISTIINNGLSASPPVYAGGGLFALTGLNGADVKYSPKVTYVGTLSDTQYLIGLNTATIGFGINSTLYFGDTLVFPKQEFEVNTISLKQTGSYSTWDSRKVDGIGGMGGSLVDGAVISPRSPIQSFVYDAFTQLTQGGRGIRITNNGYAQLVSVFTIFASVAVQVDNGGIASIVNSNANFGDLCLVAKGYGKRAFSGTVFNPPYRAYPFSPGVDGLDQYYPNGYWPNNGGKVEIYVPDSANRPHISLVMEVIPPNNYVNEYNSPELAANGIVLEGFLNAKPSTGTLVAGTISLSDIDTTDVYINNNVYILDQFGYPYDNFSYLHDDFGNPVDSNGKSTSTHYTNPAYKLWYAATGTYVTDINYNSIVLNRPLTSGASFSANINYFTLYFCGNSYYTVQTSSVATNPYLLNSNILSANTNPNYQGPQTSQITQHVAILGHMRDLINAIIGNSIVSTSAGNTVDQFRDTNLTNGILSTPFINLRFGYLTQIISAPNINSALSVVPSSEITQSGDIPTGVTSAITLIQENIDFIGSEIYYYTLGQYPTLLNGSTGTSQQLKCQRDIELICQQLIYDLETGGNYNMIYSGLSYWSRSGTYHIVELGEAVTDTELFKDGTTVNFYQRSYISASGYVFEYVGAGSNYGALPQVGQADPVQKQETVQLDSGKVFFTSTDQNGDFRIGPSLVISQATGVISGRTFTQSLFANMTPFILAIENL